MRGESANRRRRKRDLYCRAKNEFCQYRSSAFRVFQAAFRRFLKIFRDFFLSLYIILRGKREITREAGGDDVKRGRKGETGKICRLLASSTAAKRAGGSFFDGARSFRKIKLG